MWPALSPDGNCRSFDAAANGYARGEAIIAILVKPLADAIKQGDAVRAVIRGTAVNFDGRTSNLTIPNPLAQEALMRKAYLEAGLEPRDTCFIEVCSSFHTFHPPDRKCRA
jgi:acyl transferase domain-containing protein